MAKVGFLGLGIMGGPMAQHLIAAGHNVTVWTHNSEKLKKFAVDNKCASAATPADAARASQFVFLCVGDSDMSCDTILGKKGIAEGAAPNTLIVDCSTIAPSVSKQIGKALAAKKLRFIDAPVTGSKGGAETGTLTFMIGGDANDIVEVRPMLEAMGKQFYHCGAQGMGLHAKVSQNLILAHINSGFNEGLILATKAGVDPNVMLEIINNTGIKSAITTGKAPLVFAGNFDTTFSVRWLEKDVNFALELSQDYSIPVPVTAAVVQQLRAAIAAGYGDEDVWGGIRVYEDFAKVKVRTPQKKA